MNTTFKGDVLLDGETENGLEASFEIDGDSVKLIAGGTELGTWSQAECDVSPTGDGSFLMILGGEPVTFEPVSPSAFAEAMSVPLVPTPPAEVGTPTESYDYDAAIDEVIANAVATKALDVDKDMLSKPVVAGIVGISGVLMISLVTMSMLL